MKVNPWIKNIDESHQPVIGLFTQPIYFLNPKFSKGENIDKSIFKGYKSFFAATYVKWLEGSGAKVVPLIYTEPKEVLAKKISKLNGVLMPGGGGDNIEAGQFILNEVMKNNDNGKF
jgi:gamma-glutamyl hydrolase